MIARLFNTVGPRQTGRYGMVIPNFVVQALTGADITVFGDGTQSRCFTHVNDAVDALVGIAAHPDANGEVYNVGGDHEITILELAERIKQMTGSQSRIVLVPYSNAYEAGFEDMVRRVPDITKLNRADRLRANGVVGGRLESIIEDQRARLAPARRPGPRLSGKQLLVCTIHLLQEISNMRVLVTGGAGFLGSHLCDALLARGDSVVCADNLLTGRMENIAHLRDRASLRVSRAGCLPALRFRQGRLHLPLRLACQPSRLSGACHRDSASRLARHDELSGAGEEICTRSFFWLRPPSVMAIRWSIRRKKPIGDT